MANLYLRNLATKIRKSMYDFYSKSPKNYSFFFERIHKRKRNSNKITNQDNNDRRNWPRRYTYGFKN